MKPVPSHLAQGLPKHTVLKLIILAVRIITKGNVKKVENHKKLKSQLEYAIN